MLFQERGIIPSIRKECKLLLNAVKERLIHTCTHTSAEHNSNMRPRVCEADAVCESKLNIFSGGVRSSTPTGPFTRKVLGGCLLIGAVFCYVPRVSIGCALAKQAALGAGNRCVRRGDAATKREVSASRRSESSCGCGPQ